SESFNWPHVFRSLHQLCSWAGFQWQRREFYIVVFRSKLRVDANRARLHELDQKSHEEACASGGLLKYWFGSCDPARRNLATCVWLSRRDAAIGGRGPWHRNARGAARDMKESISFHTHKLIVDAEVECWWLEQYSD
ncbi:hypothetical protein M433DRAFT_62667, partial [Acidomyces richmondensis BFW]